MLLIPQRILADISEHARETYPEECCGILVGHDADGNRKITESYRSRNVATERRHERYLIDPRKHFEVDKALRGLPVDIVGFYHSHPNHPSRPSAYDIETVPAPGYSYVIVSVRKDKVESFQSWVMPDGGDSFLEEPIAAEETAQT